MSCTNCNNGCGCHSTPCVSATCGCAVYLSSDCINDVKSTFECLDIASNLSLTETLEAIDAQICVLFDSITNYFTLVNTGSGVEIYSGVNNLGQKKIRKLNETGTLLTITQNTDDITFAIDETVLNTFIEANQKTTVGAQLDAVTGKNIYKNTTTVGDVSTLNFRSLILESQGAGESLVRDLQENTNDVKGRFKSFKSDTLSITSTSTEISIEQPLTASIPALYVNNLYEPTYQEWLSENTVQNGTAVIGFEYIGKGTLAQPFTDTYVYTLGAPLTAPTVTTNSAIQNSLEGDAVYSYVGSGTRLAPTLSGQKIIVQDNNTGYTFTGDFNYSDLNIEIQGSIATTTTGYLVDMDDLTAFDEDTARLTIDLNADSFLTVLGLGFNNSGNTSTAGSFATGKQVILKGLGSVVGLSSNINRYLLNSDPIGNGNGTTGFENDGRWQFEVRCILSAEFQGIYKIGGKSAIYCFGGTLQSGDISSDVDITLKAFHQTGGLVKLQDNSNIILYGYSTTTRTDGFYFEPLNSFEPVFSSVGTDISGTVENLFTKANSSSTTFSFISGGYLINTDQVFASPNLWQVNFKDNSIASGEIDITVADTTQGNTISSINTIGNNLVQILRKYDSKATAAATGLPIGSCFLNQNTVTAGSFVVGNVYRILTVGSTNYTLIGSANNTIGTFFTASGVGSGSGTSTRSFLDILI